MKFGSCKGGPLVFLKPFLSNKNHSGCEIWQSAQHFTLHRSRTSFCEETSARRRNSVIENVQQVCVAQVRVRKGGKRPQGEQPTFRRKDYAQSECPQVNQTSYPLFPRGPVQYALFYFQRRKWKWIWKWKKVGNTNYFRILWSKLFIHTLPGLDVPIVPAALSIYPLQGIQKECVSSNPAFRCPGFQ